MNFLCFDTEDNSKELIACGFSGFDKAVTQFAAITAEGKKFYAGCPVKPSTDVAKVLAELAAFTKAHPLKRFRKLRATESAVMDQYFKAQRAHQPILLKACKAWLHRQDEKFIYALNVGYDAGNLFSKELDTLDTTLVGGRVIRSVWGNKVFVDVFNIWPMSVKKLGAAFGLEKLETDDMAGDKEYVFRDTEIIRRAMLFAWQFCQPLGIDNLPPTLGGLCVKTWKALGGTNCHDSTVLSREAYYGGRVELFKKVNDTDNVAYTDINSLYPAMMLREFPAELEEWDVTTPLPKFGVAKVRVKIPKTDFAPLPWRSKDGRIFYPWGTIEGAWTIHELNAAVQRGCVIEKVFECYGTNESAKPYAAFVLKLYEARLAAKTEAEKLFYKLLMNNLYGRLGAGGKISRTVWQNDRNKHDGVPFGEKVLVEYQMPLAEETNWVHAAYVTAYGRVTLLEFMETVGADKMIYCDTDSCIFDCADKVLPFKVGTELGMMKLEGWETGCETYAPKMYRAGKKWKAKGVPQRLAEVFIQTGRAEYDLPFKMREAIRFYDRKNSRRLSVWRTVEKVNRQNYDRKNFKNNRFTPCQKRLDDAN